MSEHQKNTRRQATATATHSRSGTHTQTKMLGQVPPPSPSNEARPIRTAVAYCRVASRYQKDHAAVERQRDRCRQLAAEFDADIAEQFIDLGKSGTTAQRPALQALLDYVTQHHVTYVIVSTRTQLARDVDRTLQLEHQLLERGCTLIIGSIDGLSATAIGIAASSLAVSRKPDGQAPEPLPYDRVTVHRFELSDNWRTPTNPPRRGTTR